MTAPVPENFLDDRYHELARLRQRTDRAESAVGRVLLLIEGVAEVKTSEVRAAIAGPVR